MFEFFGQDFVHKFIISDHHDSLTMLSACRLLSYAHSMALTGLGTRTMLLELKSHVIQNLTANLKSSNFLLSPQSLTAILVLSAPIVCLVSHDLPNRLSMWDYLIASMQDDNVCCPESAETAQRALKERTLHRQATRRLFDTSSESYLDAESTTLLRYVSNWMNISMALDAASYQNTPSARITDLFPPTGSCDDCPIPDAWASPLTSKSVTGTSTAPVETKTLVLAYTVQRWLSTFFHGSAHISVPTKHVLQDRRELRKNIENFEPVSATSTPELEAIDRE
ncbi:hypothetical protein LTR84_001436 [Exophiala bonariae]|uniref:Transcription factor domain-containing protein n=1 Tax=Exophiala bonariae TaxID=1690606 RepID=A0AAV9NCM7_9EURO|nr:hypothetical protein LTR84_001436 [Exophiala bonariae]